MYRTLNAFCAASCGLLLGATVGILLIPSPSKAATLQLEGDLSSRCTLTAGSDGVLVHEDGTISSRGSGGSPATVSHDTIGTGWKLVANYTGTTIYKDGATGGNWTAEVGFDSKAFSWIKSPSSTVTVSHALTSLTGTTDVDLRITPQYTTFSPGTYRVTQTLTCTQ